MLVLTMTRSFVPPSHGYVILISSLYNNQYLNNIL